MVMFALIIRVGCLVMFFMPSLGLFSVLRHLQAEQTRWHPDLQKNFVSDDTMQLGNGYVDWNILDRWQKDVDVSPHHKLYTGLTLGGWSIYLLASFVLHFFAIWLFYMFGYKQNEKALYKHYQQRRKNEKCFRIRHHFELFIHIIEAMQIPVNLEEWDTAKEEVRDNGARKHEKRMKLNWREGIFLMSVNLFFNLVLLIPLFVLRKL